MKPESLCSNPIICPKHGMLVPVSEHSHNIYRYLLHKTFSTEDPVRDWFEIAAGIESVSYNSALFDDNVFSCNPAIEYDEKLSKFRSNLLLQLTKFSYIWGGFEALLDSVNLPGCPFERGKINSLCHYLSSKVNFNLTYYTELTELLKKYISLNPWYGEVNKLFDKGKCCNDMMEGIKAVYRIRNLFAHGALRFSEPDGYSGIKSQDIKIIHIASRITLMTIQYLLSVEDITNTFKISRNGYSLGDSDLRSEKFILKLHLKNYDS